MCIFVLRNKHRSGFLKMRTVERYLYEGYTIEYCGFMIDGYYCFQYEGGSPESELIYLSKTKLETLQKL